MSDNAFRAAGYSWRLYCGRQVIEQSLKEAVDRAGAKRAFVVCSPSVNRHTDTVRRIEAALGNRYAGVFDGIEKDSTYVSVHAATQAAREAAADMLIAVGGGSVIVATRAVAITSSIRSSDSALRRLGRFSVRIPSGPSFSKRMFANAMDHLGRA